MSQPIDTYRQIIDLIARQWLHGAMKLLEVWSKELQQPLFADRLRNIRTYYHYLLQYFINNQPDPQREDVLQHLACDLGKIADEMLDAMRQAGDSGFEYAALRSHTAQADTAGQVSLKRIAGYAGSPATRTQYEQAVDGLFDDLWLLPADEAALRYKTIMSDGSADATIRCMAVSALTLSLIRSYSDTLFGLLLDTCAAETEQAHVQRALVGLCLVGLVHDRRISLNVDLCQRISMLATDTDMRDRLEQVVILLVRTAQTEDVSRRMNNEILPEMIKMSRRLHGDRPSIDLIAADNLDEPNPEWANLLENSELGRRLNQLYRLQADGADVYMSSFSHLKSYAFFHRTSHWFLPFDSRQTDISGLTGSTFGQVLERMMQHGPLCNSDRYSFCLTLAQMGAEQREQIENQLGEQLNQVEENDLNDDGDRALTSTRIRRRLNHYIQDLYRFYTLFRSRQSFHNPFKDILEIHHTHFFSLIFAQEHTEEWLAETMLKINRFEHALELYERMAQRLPTAGTFQKIGYCHQQLHNLTDARHAYERADLLQSDDAWTLRHLAHVARLSGDYTRALDCYERIMPHDADQPVADRKTALIMAQCMLMKKEYEQALQLGLRLDLEQSNDDAVGRLIAWATLLCNKLPLAERYAHQLIERPTANTTDWLNAAHIAWCMNRREDAVQNYRQSLNMAGSTEDFVHAFDADCADLIRLGQSEQDLKLLLDLILQEEQTR